MLIKFTDVPRVATFLKYGAAQRSVSLPSEPRNSKAWYLIPIFLGIVGGIIMYVILRQDK